MTKDQFALKTLWQNLPTEVEAFKPSELEHRATSLQKSLKRRDLREYLGYVGLLVIVAYVLVTNGDLLNWIASVLVVLGAIIAFFNFNKYSRFKKDYASGESTLSYLRNELRRQRNAHATAWRWYLLPFLPSVLFVFGFRWVEEGVTLFEITDGRLIILFMSLFIVAFFGSFILWTFLMAAKYQREIDVIDRAMR